MIIKVCGLKNSEDALFSVACGANSVGINFYPPSPRFVTDQEAERICKDLEGLANRVGVFVGWPEHNYPYLDVLQIHGLKAVEEIGDRFTEQEVWIACRPEDAPLYLDFMVVIDTSWGRGVTADWGRLASLKQSFVLSGGLNATNVTAAIQQLQLAGVDVCTGVESGPGQKDRHKIQAFLAAVQSS